jgi:hypothetical protein
VDQHLADEERVAVRLGADRLHEGVGHVVLGPVGEERADIALVEAFYEDALVFGLAAQRGRASASGC